MTITIPVYCSIKTPAPTTNLLMAQRGEEWEALMLFDNELTVAEATEAYLAREAKRLPVAEPDLEL